MLFCTEGLQEVMVDDDHLIMVNPTRILICILLFYYLIYGILPVQLSLLILFIILSIL